MTPLPEMGELYPKIAKISVSIRNDSWIMKHQNPNSPIATYLLEKVKDLELEVFSVFKRDMERRNVEKTRDEKFREISETFEVFEKVKNAEIALLNVKLEKQRSTFKRQRRQINKLALERNLLRKELKSILKRQKNQKNLMKHTKSKLRSIPNDIEDHPNSTISQKYVVESGESESGFLSQKTDSAKLCGGGMGGGDISCEETETVLTVDSEESCKTMRDKEAPPNPEIELEVVAEKATCEIEILSEKKTSDVRKEDDCQRIFPSVGESRLKHQVVVFVGKWMKTNVSSFDYSEANIRVVQEMTNHFFNLIKRQHLRSNPSLEGIQLSLDQKAAITQKLEKSYSC